MPSAAATLASQRPRAKGHVPCTLTPAAHSNTETAASTRAAAARPHAGCRRPHDVRASCACAYARVQATRLRPLVPGPVIQGRLWAPRMLVGARAQAAALCPCCARRSGWSGRARGSCDPKLDQSWSCQHRMCAHGGVIRPRARCAFPLARRIAGWNLNLLTERPSNNYAYVGSIDVTHKPTTPPR